MLCFRLGKKLTPLLLRASPYEQANSPRSEQLLPDVGRVAHDDIEAALGEDFGEGGRPVEGFGVDRRVADDAVAIADAFTRLSSSCCPLWAPVSRR